MHAIKTDSLLCDRLWAKKKVEDGSVLVRQESWRLPTLSLSVLTVDLSLLPQQHPEVIATGQGVRV